MQASTARLLFDTPRGAAPATRGGPKRRRRRGCFTIIALPLLLLSAPAAAAAQEPAQVGPPAGAAPTSPTVLVVPPGLERAAGALARPPEGTRILVAPPPPGPWVRPTGPAHDAWQQYVGMDFERALETVRDVVVQLESHGRTQADFDALAEAVLLRGMCELALRREDAARGSFLAAARLRPGRELPEDRYPPPVREAYETQRRAIRAEPASSLTVTVRPTGARLFVDGVQSDAAPATLRATSGRHQLRIEALGYAPRTLAIDLRPEGAAPLAIELPPAEEADGARDALGLEGDPGEAARSGLSQSLGARRLIRARPAAAGGIEVLWLDLETGEARSARAPALAAALDAVSTGPRAATARDAAGRHRNDGLFLRFALGVNLRGDSFDQGDPAANGSAGTVAGDFELAVGGSLGKGFVLGGALLMLVGSSTIEARAPATGQGSIGSVGGLAVFLAWYPGGEGGFHLYAALGAARGSLGDVSGSVAVRDNMVGASAALGAGYEWWLADDWAAGAMLRLIGFQMERDGTKASAGGLSLLGTFTWN